MTDWSIEENDTLRRLWAEGKSFSEIGAAVGRTKNAAISRARKLKLPSRGLEHFNAHAKKNAKKRWLDALAMGREVRKKKAQKKPFSIKRTTPRERKPPMFLRAVPAPDTVPVSLFERTGCCYPVTPHGPHLFCNAKPETGDYCEFHWRLMYPRKAAA